MSGDYTKWLEFLIAFVVAATFAGIIFHFGVPLWVAGIAFVAVGTLLTGW